jgi:ABC-type glycerol-3-phosphate transport system permease component
VVLNLVGTLLSTSMVGYGFAKLRAPGKDPLFSILLATMMIPGIVTMIPVYLMFRNFGWIDTYKPLWVPSFFAVATGDVFLFRQFFLTIPSELDDAARIDGANSWQIFFKIYVPLSKPAYATMGFSASRLPGAPTSAP